MTRAAIALVALLAAAAADAVVLCARPKSDGTYSTNVKIREACKDNENPLNPVALGLQGPKGDTGEKGDPGEPGPQGEPGVCTCSTTTTTVSTTTSTTTTMPPEETVNVPFCGNGLSPTAHAYAGVVELTVSGIAENSPGHPLSDPFYFLTDPPAADPPVFRVVRASEGTCTCYLASGCPAVSVASLLLDPYPAYNAAHEYTVRIDLGDGPAEPLIFGFADCGCWDNTGTFTVTLRRST